MKKKSPKRARIKAIAKTTGFIVPSTYNRKQIAEFVRLNIYGTPRWRKYRTILNRLRQY